MRVPLSWLAEYVDLPTGSTPDTVMAELVKVGLEEEGVHGFDLKGPIVVGQVLEFVEEPQTNGKTIRWCQVRVAPAGQKAADGGADVRGIVCGASNFLVEDKVIVCLPGAVLPANFEIAARSTYGHISDGMMASARELTLSDDHLGILRLSEMGLDPEVGTDAFALLSLDDRAAEVNVTPDRGYCLSIRGVAREFAHATGAEFRDPTGIVQPVSNNGFALSVDDQAPIRQRTAVTRFVLQVVRGVDPSKPTPAWMISRLKLSGMRSISLIVDITNYVMLEMGQPIHAYDLDKLSGGITVRRAQPGETLKTLDGQIRKLHAEDLVIADESGAVGLAGVMGGESTEVSSTTKNILIEAANFDPISIARSARRHKLPSEASKRFERGVDNAVAEYAAARVVQLLQLHASGEADSLGADYRNIETPTAIWLPGDFATELVGVDYSQTEISDILSDIGCVVAKVDGGFEVLAPSWRSDVTHKTDLVEEIARIAGYHRIPSRLPVAPPGRGLTLAQRQRRAVSNMLAATGHVEVLTYPFTSTLANRWFANQPNDLATVRLANPIQEEAPELRTWILPGLIDAARRNLSRGLTDLAIFESGLVFHPSKAVTSTGELPVGNHRPSVEQLAVLNETVPNQPRHLAAVFLGNRIPQQVGQREHPAGYQEAIQAARTVAHAVGVELVLKQVVQAGFHPGRAAELFVAQGSGQVSVGFAGELDPNLTVANDLPRRVPALELDLDVLTTLAPAVVQARPISTFPAATQDLSLVVDLAVPAAEVLAAIVQGAADLLEHATLIDDYRGSNVEAGKKSLTFALRFRAFDRTLTQTEASASRDAAVALCETLFGATIRA
jgi:phenylalanyl-tRNA synthetase beta chain